ncbi:MAG: D-glycero-beta-D-manno-heptose 1,7-bisphosphate 7-phosphatase [Desulfobacteraceae bacterium]|nr:D-glycero-beta-D-manno-heptose 1,7-bisphosphate 7-phosphatase [Desulfobacteraceae bacterium]MCB9494242.1 D-glycero-beta-D-manno-heptose 1,7-bisphosphate 7-phosphatase [Desulfobacteraceae bacterium]
MDKKPVVFIDRDGVINFDSPDYIKSCDELFFIPQSIDAIANLSMAGHDVFVITNQSVIGRKMVTPEDLKKIFAKMTDAVKEKNGNIKEIFFCPHIPKDNCSCRKPAPGLFFQARDKYGLDLSNSVMIGDSSKDIIAAENAGVKFKILVLTGNGKKAQKELEEKKTAPDYIAENLYDAHNWIIKNTGPR